ncbi:unnamed protein product [Camellia sinensis]
MGPPGDLYVYLDIEEIPEIQRDGINLRSSVSISYLDAILGTVVKLKTVEGTTDQQIPSGTQPGDVLVLAKKGAPKLNRPSIRAAGLQEKIKLVPIDLQNRPDWYKEKVDIAYAPFIERFYPLLLDVKKYDITTGRPMLTSRIEKSDVLGQFMPLVGMDWSQTGVVHLYSAIKTIGSGRLEDTKTKGTTKQCNYSLNQPQQPHWHHHTRSSTGDAEVPIFG